MGKIFMGVWKKEITALKNDGEEGKKNSRDRNEKVINFLKYTLAQPAPFLKWVAVIHTAVTDLEKQIVFQFSG